jgi:hypothetical protein
MPLQAQAPLMQAETLPLQVLLLQALVVQVLPQVVVLLLHCGQPVCSQLLLLLLFQASLRAPEDPVADC